MVARASSVFHRDASEVFDVVLKLNSLKRFMDEVLSEYSNSLSFSKYVC